MKLNQVAHLQTEIVHAYMRQHNLNPTEFVELDHKYGILRFIEIGYEPFHLTGTQGVLDEVEDYVKIQSDYTKKLCMENGIQPLNEKIIDRKGEVLCGVLTEK